MIRAGDFLWRPVAANEGELSPTQDWHSNSILFRAVADLEPGDEHVCVSEVVKWSWPTRVDRRTTTFLQSAPFGHHRASSWDQGDPWWVRPHSCLLLGALGQQWIKAHPSASNPTESRTVSRVVLDLIALNAATVRYAAQNQITRFGEAESPLPAPAQPVQQVALSGPGTVTRSHTQGKRRRPEAGEDRRVQAEEAVSEARLEQLRRCEDTCHQDPEPGRPECTVLCKGSPRGACQRKIHAKCVGLARGQVYASSYLCSHCTAKSLTRADASAVQKQALVVQARRQVLRELTSRLGRNTKGFLTLRNYIRRVETELGLEHPFTNVESFKFFLSWLCDEGYDRSLDTHSRSAGTLMCLFEQPDLTKSPEVKAWIRHLKAIYGEHHEPDTALPWSHFLICWELLQIWEDQGLVSHLVVKRLRVQVLLEFVGGYRVGEASGAGQGHGLNANDLLWNPELIEALLHHSKTANFTEEIVITGKSVDGPDFVGAIEAYLQAWGMPIVKKGEDTGTEYFVARVSLVAMTPAQMATVLQAFRTCDDPGLRDAKHLAWLATRMKARVEADDDLLHFFNVVGGSRPLCEAWANLLVSRGVPTRVLAGPMLRATRGFTFGTGPARKTVQIPTHMPLDTATAGQEGKGLITASHELYQQRVRDKQMAPDADAEKIVSPKWASHSFRRGGTRKAQLTMHLSGATEELIDLHFRWRSKVIKKKMQNVYGGIRPRQWRLKVTKHF